MKKIILVGVFVGLFMVSCSTKSNQLEGTEEHVLTELETDSLLNPYKEIGLEYARATQQVLGKNLMDAIKTGGTEHALSFCNIQAIALTDSMSNLYHVEIKRATDKARNPDNKANALELDKINHFKALVNEKILLGDIEPIVEKRAEKIHFYYPILTNAMCLQCHGVKQEEISPKTLASIRELYPKDEATGYSENEVRGIWSLVFDIKE